MDWGHLSAIIEKAVIGPFPVSLDRKANPTKLFAAVFARGMFAEGIVLYNRLAMLAVSILGSVDLLNTTVFLEHLELESSIPLAGRHKVGFEKACQGLTIVRVNALPQLKTQEAK